MSNPTQEIYSELQKAYDFFNSELFFDELPQCLMTIQRKRTAKGYFAPNWWKNKKGSSTDEIAINPDFIKEKNIEEVLSTLVHEMSHLWQAHFGKPSKGNYHNKQWADKMESVGLMPSDTGAEGGNRIGFSMTHYIIPDDKFQKAFNKLKKKGNIISWFDDIHQIRRSSIKIDIEAIYAIEGVDVIKGLLIIDSLKDQEIIDEDFYLINSEKVSRILKEIEPLLLGEQTTFSKEVLKILQDAFKKSKKKNKVKYRCDVCDINAWAKPDVSLVCGLCNHDLEVVE